MPASPAPTRFIARQVALGFGSVSIVAVVMCAMLLGIIYDVSGLVDGMRHDESAIRQGRELATATRELSTHIAQAALDPDDAHFKRYEQWRAQVRARIQAIASHIPEGDRFRLQVLGERTQRMHDLLVSAALPAARRGNSEAARDAHRQIALLGTQAAQQADAIARGTASRMAHAHVLATDSIRFGLVGGGLCVALVVALSVGFTLHLRSAVLQPLLVLTQSAKRLGEGAFSLRVGQVGKGELAALGNAFDRMADELLRRESRLLQNERMAALGQLAAGVAHELNNPIAIIRGYLKTMTPDGDVETLREELSILDEEAAQCQRIAESLLSYARTGELCVGDISMEQLLEEAARRFGETSAGEGRSISVSAADSHVEGDGARLRQVVLNLLTNAAQASPKGSAIELRGEVCGTNYQIEVEDCGPGVAPEDRAKIFEPFFSRRGGGTGLGLSVCLGIVQAHRGRIEVHEGDQGGAVLRVALPLSQAAPTQDVS